MKLSKTAPLGPLPNNPAQTRDLSTAATPDINGLAIEGENFKPAQNVWTQQAVISFSENVVVSSPATEENPAILAAPLNLRNQKTGVIELISSDPGRKWSEEDRLLMQEISNQLGLALENAQLYSTVQKELGERVKAEEMTSRRNRDLSTLNEIGQRLSRLVSREEIFPLVSTMIQQTLELKNLLISLYPKLGSVGLAAVASDSGYAFEATQVSSGIQDQAVQATGIVYYAGVIPSGSLSLTYALVGVGSGYTELNW